MSQKKLKSFEMYAICSEWWFNKLSMRSLRLYSFFQISVNRDHG
jgi:hypothetical protein